MTTNLPTLPDPDSTLADTVDVLLTREGLSRRRMLRRLGGAALLLPSLRALADCPVIPSETGGPYPGDGTNGPNVLTQTGIVRSDIRSSFGTAGASVAGGIPLTLVLNLVNTNASCAALGGYAIYVWHCDASGRYSMYSAGVTGENFLRGVQVTDTSGRASFTTIVPGCYSGRWPHIHFEIYASTATAIAGNNALKTSQLGLPAATCQAVYSGASALYPSSATNLSQVSLATDNVFSDGYALQLPTVTGSNSAGYVATLQVGIASATSSASNAITVEFYNTDLDHYVMVTDPAEIASIDAGGAGAGWSRTGRTFEFEPAPGSNSMPVYRFYGSLTPGPNSHFYTLSEAEKALLISIAAATPADQKRWNYESAGGFWAGGVTPAGACSASNAVAYTVPIYRLYNNGFAKGVDSNHRYTGSVSMANEMVAQGWTLEGVVFCALRYN